MLVLPRPNLGPDGNEMANEGGDGVRRVEEGPQGLAVPGIERTGETLEGREETRQGKQQDK